MFYEDYWDIMDEEEQEQWERNDEDFADRLAYGFELLDEDYEP